MNKKTWGIILIVVAVLMVAVDFLAVPLHLGAAAFGVKKFALLGAAVVALVAGLILTLGKGKK